MSSGQSLSYKPSSPHHITMDIIGGDWRPPREVRRTKTISYRVGGCLGLWRPRKSGGDGTTDPLHGYLGLLLRLSQLPDTFTAPCKSVCPGLPGLVPRGPSRIIFKGNQIFQFLSDISSSDSASLVWTTPWECRPALTSVATTLQQRMGPHLLHLIMLQLHHIMLQLHLIMPRRHHIMPQHQLHPTTPTPPAALWLFPTPGPISRPRRMIRFE